MPLFAPVMRMTVLEEVMFVREIGEGSTALEAVPATTTRAFACELIESLFGAVDVYVCILTGLKGVLHVTPVDGGLDCSNGK